MADFSEINKRGGSKKACSWENFLKKNKKNSMLIRDFRVTIKPDVKNVKVSKNRNEFMKTAFLPKYQRKSFKDFCPGK